jgi:hypothetical protein
MKPAEEVADMVVRQWYAKAAGDLDPDDKENLTTAVTAAIESERQRLKDAEKWMRHLDGCALGSRIAYNSMTKSFCTCGLDDFRKEK